MKDVTTVRDEHERYYVLRFVKQAAGNRKMKWASAERVGSHSKQLASGDEKSYDKRSWTVSNKLEKAHLFENGDMPKRLAKIIKCFKPLYDDGWEYQVVEVTVRTLVTQEELIVDPINPLLALAQVAS